MMGYSAVELISDRRMGVEGRWYKMAFQRGVGVGQRGEEGLFSARIDKFEIDRS